MNEGRILNGARRMFQRHMIRISQAYAGTNLKRRVNTGRNYIKDLKKLENYLYGGRSNVQNIQGFGRNRLREDIRMAEQMHQDALREHLFHLGRNVLQTARNMYQEYMVPYNRNSTLTAKKMHFQRRAHGFRRVQQYLTNQIRNEPGLAEDERIKRVVQKTEMGIRKLNAINHNLNTALKEIQSRKRKYPGSFY